ncbi:MAG: hypothetical protein EBT63_00445 [Proteobacteria bacterium]|nr:hypothetical protein [Pseudomonadota bacterium]NCA28047.1 hypothetical protein [Pseudomonadota bacterium]
MLIKQEILRKLFHIGLSIIPLLYINLGKTSFLCLFIPLAIAIIGIDFCRCKYNSIGSAITPIFKIIMREKELSRKNLSGVSWAFFCAIINFLIFHPAVAVTGFLILTFADAMAAVIGKSVKSAKFYQKSRAGSLAFFITSILVIISCGIYFDCRLPFFLFASFVAMFVTYLEAYPDLFRIDDNLLIPMSFGICMTLLDLMWHIL